MLACPGRPARLPVLLPLLGALAACALEPGDMPPCPICDNTTELLVGWRCVPIVEVAPCGPDGHAHGTECHCFHGQEPTPIDGADYCLQPGCDAGEDPDALACEEIDRPPEAVEAVSDLADIEGAHVDLGHAAEIALPAGQRSFVHFGAPAVGPYHVYLDTAGALEGAQNLQQAALEAEDEGPAPACDDLPETWHVTVTAPGPVVLRFSAGALPSLRLVVCEGAAHAP